MEIAALEVEQNNSRQRHEPFLVGDVAYGHTRCGRHRRDDPILRGETSDGKGHSELLNVDGLTLRCFIVTNLDVTSGAKAAAVEHWYRHRTSIENLFRDAKHGAALRHLPSGHPEVNRAWMWGALLAASLAGWLHQLTARAAPDGALRGHGVRHGQAMLATLRHRLIRVPARLIRHAGTLVLRLPPGHHLLAEVLTRIRTLPATS